MKKILPLFVFLLAVFSLFLPAATGNALAETLVLKEASSVALHQQTQEKGLRDKNAENSQKEKFLNAKEEKMPKKISDGENVPDSEDVSSEAARRENALLQMQEVMEEISRLGGTVPVGAVQEEEGGEEEENLFSENEEDDFRGGDSLSQEKGRSPTFPGGDSPASLAAELSAAVKKAEAKRLSAPFITKEDWASVPEGMEPTKVRSAYSRTKQVWKENYEREQLVVSLILKLPEEYHQYFMPAIADSLYFSVKTRTMPQVRKYRGKKPTRVAPELKEFVEQGFLDDLPPALYYAVMPEAWPSYYISLARELPPQKHYTPQEVTDVLIEAGKNPPPPSVLARAEKASGFPKLKGAPLAKKDIQSVLSVMQSLKEKADNPAYKQMRRDLNRYVMENKDEVFEMFVSPCRTMAKAFSKSGHGDFFAAELAVSGLTTEEFSDKCDRVFTAARVAGLSSLKGAEIGRIRREFSSIPETAALQRQAYEMILKMHTAPREDVEAIRPFRRQVLDTFREQANSSSFWKIPFSSK